MYVVCVHIHVKPEHREEFIRATQLNHEGTIQEQGCLRFDVIQQIDDPNRFMLYEVYRDEAAIEAHRATAHYATWRDTVTPWMAEPRTGVRHNSLFPKEAGAWRTRKA